MHVLKNFKDLSLRTGTCKLVLDHRWRGISSGTTTLSLYGPCHCPCDLLRCVTYDAMFFSRPYLIRSRLCYSVASVCRLSSSSVCTECIAAKRCVLGQKLGTHIWEIDWYQNEWPCPLFRGCIKVMSTLRFIRRWISRKPFEIEAWLIQIKDHQ